MRCEQVQEILNEYQLDELDSATSLAVQEQLRSQCLDGCRDLANIGAGIEMLLVAVLSADIQPSLVVDITRRAGQGHVASDAPLQPDRQHVPKGSLDTYWLV